MGLKKREQTMAEGQALIEGWTKEARDGLKKQGMDLDGPRRKITC